MKRVVVITGGSGGIGKSAAALFAKNGFAVYELSRRGEDADGVTHITADVSDEAAVDAAFLGIFEKEGRIDVLVNNAGYGISGAVEFTPIEDAKRLFDVNFFGVAACTKAVLPYMRKSGGGRIVSLSSVAGFIPIPFQAYYSAAKAAISALTFSVANEVRPFGISLSTLMPGDVRTGFTDARKKNHAGDDIYGGRIGRSVATMEHDEQTGMTTEYVAKKIYRAATKKRVRSLYTVGVKYKMLVFIARILPGAIASRIVYMLYAK